MQQNEESAPAQEAVRPADYATAAAHYSRGLLLLGDPPSALPAELLREAAVAVGETVISLNLSLHSY